MVGELSVQIITQEKITPEIINNPINITSIM